MRCRQSVLLVAMVFLFRASASAHDLWLIPPETANAKQPAIVLAHVGMDFPKSVIAPATERYPSKFVVRGDGKTADVKSAGKKFSAFLEAEVAPGINVIAVSTTPRILELDADKLNEYLITDGMPHIYRLRAKEKTLNQPAKSMQNHLPPWCESATVRWASGTSRSICPCRLCLCKTPLSEAGDTLRVRVYFEQKPLPGANLGWHRCRRRRHPRRHRPHRRQGGGPDSACRHGLLTIRLTHITRPKTPDYEWESFWTTLTFRVPAKSVN